MDRRSFLSGGVALGSIAVFAPRLSGAAATPVFQGDTLKLAAPRQGRVQVAFLISDNANVIDTAGPWEVFQDVMLHDGGHHNPFQLFTVAEKKEMVRMTGGLQVVPHYSIDDAPQPQVVVVPAMRGTPRTHEWLRKSAEHNDVTMSVCTGAFQLARAGLLDGKSATTHHQYWDEFAKEFPRVNLKRGLRFVDNGRIATAGGLTSGFDMALHVVSRYFGRDAAQATARYMEYQSEEWQAGS